MEFVVPILSSLSLFLALPVFHRLRCLVRRTTLLSAWNWAVIAWGAWEIAWICHLFPIQPAIQDQLWYGAAILGLCPPIAVLGAKRPGSRVWAAFILFPLVLVFSWPALVEWVYRFPPQRLQLETPMLLGYGLVLVMGYGNYLGTRHSLAAFLTAAAYGGLALELAQSPQPDQSLQPVGPTLLLVLACVVGMVFRNSPPERFGWNRVWWDFQEAFGLVWGRRVMDRINQTARQEQWNAEWNAQGLAFSPEISDAEKSHAMERVDHTLRWLLRRFVDSEWIDERLEPNNSLS